MDVFYVYTFDDGTVLTLLNFGFSTDELWKMKELHGNCKIEIFEDGFLQRIKYEFT